MSNNRACGAFSGFVLPIILSVMVSTVTGLSAQTPGRVIGTLTAIAEDSVTVRTDAGESRQVQIRATVSVLRVAPGQRDLSSAEAIKLGDLAIGDRILVKFDSDQAGSSARGVQIIAIKQSDVAQKQQKDSEEWQIRGVSGLVKSIDSSTGVIVLTTSSGPTAKAVTVHVVKATVLKRYAPGSMRYADARLAPFDSIRVGDQMRVRGEKNADGSDINADEAVSGSFRSIAGTITALDVAKSTLTVKDLSTKKQVTIHVVSEAQMHRLPDMMAQMIAMQLSGKAPSGSFGGFPGGGPPPGMVGGQAGPPSGMPAKGTGLDIQRILSRAPVIHLTDLQKGEAVMVVSSEGELEVKAITLLAGVEPLLQSPEASRNLLSNWSMSSGASDAPAQ